MLRVETPKKGINYLIDKRQLTELVAMLDAGADVNLPDNYDYYDNVTPLAVAIWEGCDFQQGDDPNLHLNLRHDWMAQNQVKFTNFGETNWAELERAYAEFIDNFKVSDLAKRTEIVKLLIQKGADVNIVNEFNFSTNTMAFMMNPPNPGIYIAFNENSYRVLTRFTGSGSSSTSVIRLRNGSRELAKLLICNGMSKKNFLPGAELSDEFIADVFFPLAISPVKLADVEGTFFDKLPITQLDAINDNLIGLMSNIRNLCGINEQRAKIIAKLIIDRAHNLTPEKLSQQQQYLLRSVAKADIAIDKRLIDIVFMHIVRPIRLGGVLDPNIKNGAVLKEQFTTNFRRSIVTQDQLDCFNQSTREQISKWSNEIANIIKEHHQTVNIDDMQIIFSVILYAAMNNKKEAMQLLNSLNNRRRNKAYVTQLFAAAMQLFNRQQNKAYVTQLFAIVQKLPDQKNLGSSDSQNQTNPTREADPNQAASSRPPRPGPR